MFITHGNFVQRKIKNKINNKLIKKIINIIINIFTILAEVPGVTYEIFKKFKKKVYEKNFHFLTSWIPMGSLKQSQPIWFSNLGIYNKHINII